LTDDGPDYQFHTPNGKSSLSNIFEYGRLWEETNVSGLVVFSYISEKSSSKSY
jgi:hypothetical protein